MKCVLELVLIDKEKETSNLCLDWTGLLEKGIYLALMGE
jgi:hypothetical protein